MRYAVSIPTFADPRTILDLAMSAEQSGWDAVLLWDHIQWIPDMGLDTFDPFGILSAIAVRTERIRLGTCITPVARRRPHVLAKQLVTLDHLSGGRVMFGAGLGEPPDADFADFGDDGDPKVRGQRLDEGLAIIDTILRGDRVDVDGEHFTAHGRLLPAAVQTPRPPIFLAGIFPNRRPLERALRWDGFFPIGSAGLLSPSQLAELLGDVEPPDGWDLFASLTDVDPAEFAAVGATWLIEGAFPMGDWVGELRGRIADGPPR